MKISKYENKLPAWRPKDTNVTLMPFLRLFTETITPERKVFLQNYMTNVVKMLTKYVRNFQHPICDVITKIGTCLFVTSC